MKSTQACKALLPEFGSTPLYPISLLPRPRNDEPDYLVSELGTFLGTLTISSTNVLLLLLDDSTTHAITLSLVTDLASMHEYFKLRHLLKNAMDEVLGSVLLFP